VNGDGKADIVGFGHGVVYVSLSTGSSFSAGSAWMQGYGVAQGWSSNNIYPRTCADVNGDGRADIVGFGSTGVSVTLSTGTSFGPTGIGISAYAVGAGGWTTFDAYPRILADVNGDGKADIVAFGWGHVLVSLSLGSTFAGGSSWIQKLTAGTGGWSNYNTYPRILADVSGDGKADIVAFGQADVDVALSTGSGFGQVSSWVQDFTVGANGWTNHNTYPRALADVTGDGVADIVGFAHNDVEVRLGTAS